LTKETTCREIDSAFVLEKILSSTAQTMPKYFTMDNKQIRTSKNNKIIPVCYASRGYGNVQTAKPFNRHASWKRGLQDLDVRIFVLH
jgi:hypothetical protein